MTVLKPTDHLSGNILDAPDTPEARKAEADAVRYIVETNERIRREKRKVLHRHDEPKLIQIDAA